MTRKIGWSLTVVLLSFLVAWLTAGCTTAVRLTTYSEPIRACHYVPYSDVGCLYRISDLTPDVSVLH